MILIPIPGVRSAIYSIITLCIFSFSVSAQNGINFDGVNDYVQTSYAGISGNSERTVEAWIKTTANADPGGGGIQQIITDWGTFVNGQRFTFCVLDGNAIRMEVGGSGLTGQTVVNDGNWHHVAGVYDPIATDPFSIYVDGVLDTSGTIITPVNTTPGTDLRIGRRIDDARNFDGTIDDVRIWNVARTQGEIASNRNAEYCTIPTSLVAYYKLNEGTASGNNAGIGLAPDAALASNDGTLVFFALTGPTSNWVAGNLASGNTSSTFIDFGCGVYNSPSGNYMWTTTNTYKDTIPNAAGCDSIMTINLNMNQVNKGISNVASVLSSTATGAVYQWLDCADNSIIVGETSQSFTPTVPGSYAVKVSENNCTDTSACILITLLEVEEFEPELLKIFPNPASTELNLSGSGLVGSKVMVVSMLGQVLSDTTPERNQMQLNVGDYPQGVYVLIIQKQAIVARKRFIVTRQ